MSVYNERRNKIDKFTNVAMLHIIFVYLFNSNLNISAHSDTGFVRFLFEGCAQVAKPWCCLATVVSDGENFLSTL